MEKIINKNILRQKIFIHTKKLSIAAKIITAKVLSNKEVDHFFFQALKFHYNVFSG